MKTEEEIEAEIARLEVEVANFKEIDSPYYITLARLQALKWVLRTTCW